MKKQAFLFTLLSVGLLFFFSCKKYEDGPAFSLASKKARVVNTWKYDKVIVDGTDKTDFYESFDPNFSFVFKNDMSYTRTGHNAEEGTWKFDSKKENIVLTENTTNNSTDYKILKLKSKELWLKVIVSNQTIEVHFK